MTWMSGTMWPYMLELASEISRLSLLRSANRVIELEPYHKLSDLARTNIRVNGFEDRAKLLNVALATSNEYTHAPGKEIREYALFRPVSRGKSIKTIAPRSIIEGYNIVNGVLKMNCEGCKYQVFNHTDGDTLKVFKQVVIEYHDGARPIAGLLKDLRYDVIAKPIRSTSILLEKQGYTAAKL